MILRLSAGLIPSQIRATSLARRGRWRSRQLALTFSTPSANQRTCRSFVSNETSSTTVTGLIQSSRCGHPAPEAVGLGLDRLLPRRRKLGLHRHGRAPPSRPEPETPDPRSWSFSPLSILLGRNTRPWTRPKLLEPPTARGNVKIIPISMEESLASLPNFAARVTLQSRNLRDG